MVSTLFLKGDDGVKSIYEKTRYLIDKSLLPKLSGNFYVSKYQPVQYVLYEKGHWKMKEKVFKIGSIAVLTAILVCMLVLMIFNDSIALWIFQTACALFALLLMGGLAYLMFLERLSSRILR